MIYLLVQHPEEERKVREEIYIHMKEDDYSYENIKKMTYLEYVEKETTRIFGPGNGTDSRVSSKDFYLKDVPISKGTFLRAQPLGTHFSDEYFSDPHVFRPKRWESECQNIPSFSFYGFGGGPRSCIGKQFAKF